MIFMLDSIPQSGLCCKQMSIKNQAAVALGRMGRGKKKTLSDGERLRRSEQAKKNLSIIFRNREAGRKAVSSNGDKGLMGEQSV